MIPILTILCGLAILFAGGCVIMTVGLGAVPVAVIPGGIVALNVLVILAIWRRRPPSFSAFATLAALDLLVAAVIARVLAGATDVPQGDDLLFARGAAALAGVLAVKGVLTLAAAARLRRTPDSAAAFLVLCMAVAGAVQAGTYNPDRAIGDVVPPWTDLPGTDGRTHSWSDLAGRDAVVVVFTCNSCPYAVDYEGRIDDLAARHAGPESRVAVVAINSNSIPEDALPAMKTRAEAKGFRFHYLFDESQAVARSFGAVRTPEFYVLDRQRRIVYMGAMDDATEPADVRRRYLDDAIAAVLAGRTPEVAETPPVGCLIRFNRRRSGGAR